MSSQCVERAAVLAEVISIERQVSKLRRAKALDEFDSFFKLRQKRLTQRAAGAHRFDRQIDLEIVGQRQYFFDAPRISRRRGCARMLGPRGPL